MAILSIDFKFIIEPKLKENACAVEYVKVAEDNKDQVFKVSKVILYSSAEAVDNTAEQNLQDVTIHQYSDMAIYIDNLSDELTEKNTIKELYIDNFQFFGPELGKPNLYYKNINDFGKSIYSSTLQNMSNG